MFKIPVFVDFSACNVSVKRRQIISGDYNSTILEFSFDSTYQGTKTFEMKSPSGSLVMVANIGESNQIALVSSNGASLFSEAGRYVFEVSLYDTNSKLTSASGYLLVDKEEVVINDSVVTPYLPVFDELLESVDTALDEMSNVNIVAEKVGDTTSVVVTDRNGIEYDFEIKDGVKGEKGDKGDRGDSGTSYSAGDGIDIVNDVVSIDNDYLESKMDNYLETEKLVWSRGDHNNNEIPLFNGTSTNDIKSSGKKLTDLQEKLIAGDNITINGNTISATSNLYGKKIYVYGDSIAYGEGYTGGYGKIIADKYGMTLSNKAVSGASLTTITGRSCINTIVTTDSTLSQADFIIIEGGINDAWESSFTNYGSVTDGYDATLSTSTTIGAFENILKHIITNNSSATLVYVFPHDGMLSVDSDWLSKVKPLLKKALDKWNVPYVDIAESTPAMGTYGISGLSTTYTSDGTHPNEAGYKRWYAEQIALVLEHPIAFTSPETEKNESAIKETLLTNTQLTTTGVKYERTTSQINVADGDYVEAVLDLSTCDDTDQELFALGCDIANWAGLNFHLYKTGTTKLAFQSCHTSSASWTEIDEVLLSTIPDTSNIVLKITKGDVSINGTTLTNASKTTSGVASAIWAQIATDGHMELGCCQYPKTVTIKSLTIKRVVTESITEERVNELIDAKLGVIENGSY